MMDGVVYGEPSYGWGPGYCCEEPGFLDLCKWKLHEQTAQWHRNMQTVKGQLFGHGCHDDYYDECDQCSDGGERNCPLRKHAHWLLCEKECEPEEHHGLAHVADCLYCKLGYFHPQGCCGAGCPPADCYHMAYAVNPEYFDSRDAQVYAAQGYGLPMAVPLAPNVNHTYNYSWGIPSSRLTPISRFYPEYGYIGR